METHRKNGHQVHLDSMRGLAALAVFFSHCLYTCGLPTSVTDLGNVLPIHFLYDGHSAVGLFFVLSGFVLSLGHIQDRTRPRFLPFAIQRVFRIYPAFWVAILITLICKVILESQGTVVGYWREPVSVRFLLEQLLLFAGSSSRLLKQDWSLALEVQFSLFLPFLLAVLSRSVGFLGLVLAIALWGAKVSPYWLHFVLGMVLAKYWEFLVFKAQALRPLTALGFGLASLYLYCFRYTPPLNLPFVSNSDLQIYIGAFGSAGLLVMVTARSAIRTALERPVFAWLGKVSYSFYLIHYTVLVVGSSVILNATRSLGAFSVGIAVVVQLAISLFIAWILYVKVEKPFQRLGKRLSQSAPLGVSHGYRIPNYR